MSTDTDMKTIKPNTKNAPHVEKEIVIHGKQYSYIVSLSWKRYPSWDGVSFAGRTVYNGRFAHNNVRCFPCNCGKKTLLDQMQVYEKQAPAGMFL